LRYSPARRATERLFGSPRTATSLLRSETLAWTVIGIAAGAGDLGDDAIRVLPARRVGHDDGGAFGAERFCNACPETLRGAGEVFFSTSQAGRSRGPTLGRPQKLAAHDRTMTNLSRNYQGRE
jgi:hypothetical protein